MPKTRSAGSIAFSIIVLLLTLPVAAQRKTPNLEATSDASGEIHLSGNFLPNRPISIQNITGVIKPTRITFNYDGGLIRARVAYYDRSFSIPVQMEASLLNAKGEVVAKKSALFDPSSRSGPGGLISSLKIPMFTLDFLTSFHPEVHAGNVPPDVSTGVAIPNGIARFEVVIKPQPSHSSAQP